MASNVIQIPTNANPKSTDSESFSPKRGRPVLFQVADPVLQRPLYPVLLALHVNPQTLSERMQKSKNVTMTYGGFVEYIWPDELDALSADQTTGAFISPRTGLTAASPHDSINRGRQGTIAWERQEDLLELFRMNGCVYNGQGLPVLRGRVMCIYDRGIYSGHFTTFQVNESDDKAFTFQLTWEFKVEQTIYKYPQNLNFATGSNDFGSFVARSNTSNFQPGVDNGQFQTSSSVPVAGSGAAGATPTSTNPAGSTDIQPDAGGITSSSFNAVG